MRSEVNHWIEQSRRGDREAFARIVTRYQVKVTAVTFSMTGRLQESEDLAQETFLTAWNKLGDLREPEKIGPWLCGIARTLCKKWFDRNHRDPLHAAAQIDRNDAEPAESLLPPNETECEKRREQADLAWSVLAEIPEQYREPMVLYYREGRSVREVAETLELTESCVKQRLHRGRQYLKRELERLVESALESTRPDTAFTLSVVAAMPAASLLGASSVLAETTSAAVGGSSVGKGGLAGISIGGTLVFLWAFVVALCVSIVGTIDCYKMLLNNIRNSPGPRSRRLTLLTDLWRTIVICFFIAAVLALISVPDTKMTPWGRGACMALAVGLCMLHAYIVANLSHGIWCRAVKEDLGLLPLPIRPIENSWLSDRSLHCFFAGALVMIGVVILVYHFLFVQSVLHSAEGLSRRPIPLGIRVFTPCFSMALFFFTAIPFALFYRKAIKLVSEKGLADDPSLVSDFLNIPESSSSLLDIFLGLSKKPRDDEGLATRRRLELMLAAILLLIPSFFLMKSVFITPNPWPGYVSILVSSVVFLLLAKFATGKSAFRPIGWAFACFFMAGFDAWLAWGWGVLETKGMPPIFSTLMAFAIAMQLFYGVVAALTCLSRRTG